MFLLDRKDRMSMYSGLEARVPFCDYRIVEYAYNMPWEFKAYHGREKGILREAMRGILPDAIVYRKKSPFPKTHNPVYFEIVSQKVREILSDTTPSPLLELLSKKGVYDIIEHPETISSPWYGQLMGAAQILAYIVQLDYWMREYNIELC